MEVLNKKIKEFLKIDISSGYGSGNGNGNGDGNGSGDGSGYGDGYGYGSGDGSGYGDGYGDGSGIKSINNTQVYFIDNIATILLYITNNIAKGLIVNRDLTLEECYVAKGQNMFAHGKTMQEAVEALRAKIFNKLDIDEKIEEFKKKFNNIDSYEGAEFYEWHHLLTGSCKTGRDNFVKNNGIDLTKKYTVKEFIEICKHSYGGEIIQRLEVKKC